MKKCCNYSFLTVAMSCLVSLQPLFAAERVALVIGNNAYKHSPPLKNCVNDAKAVADALKKTGFQVIVAEDASLEQMEAKALEFRRAAEGAKAAWFHYSGHGAEVKGMNYLIPVDADVKDEFQVKHQTFAIDQMLGAMEEAGAPLKVVVLDCCRNNPFGRGWSRSESAGLAQIGNSPAGTIIAYATSPGKVADDGAGINSPYTTALVAAISKPGLDIDQIFKETGKAVKASTENNQQPWTSSSYTDSFFMNNIINGSLPPEPATAKQPVATSISPTPPVGLPGPTSLKMPADLPATGFFDSTQVFHGTVYADFNSASRRQILQKAQEKLKAQNLYVGTIDGGMGPGSQKAILEWQARQGLTTSGRIDQATQSSLGLSGFEEVEAPRTTTPKPKATTKPKASGGGGGGNMTPEERVRRAVGL